MRKAHRELAICIGALLGGGTLLLHLTDDASTFRQEGSEPEPQHATLRREPSPFAPVAAAEQSDSIVAADSAKQRTLTSDTGLVTFAEGKYKYLFSGLRLDAGAAGRLHRLLLAREKIAIEINTARQARDPSAQATIPEREAALTRMDTEIRALLHPADYADYELLKDSNEELHRLREYVGGIQHFAPVAPEHEQAILFAKLRYKAQYQSMISGAHGLSDLQPLERAYAVETMARALDAYKENFLQEARQVLYDEQQYALLSHYESTEFRRDLVKLRSIASAR